MIALRFEGKAFRPGLALVMLCLTCSAGAATLQSSGVLISRSTGLDRVSIRLDAKADVRVVGAVEEKGFFFVDIYSTAAAFPDRVFRVQGGVLKAYETRSYPESKVLRVIFYPEDGSFFRVMDEPSGFLFPVSSLSDGGFARPGNKTASLVIEIGTATIRRDPKAPKRIVILDPGHGGRDPGAISRPKSGKGILREKDLTLSIAKALQAELNQSPDIEAVLTRKNDSHMSLKERLDFAEKKKGDLFVSIHMNATKYHPRGISARGVELYYLGKTSDPDTSALVEGENLENGPSLDPAATAQLAQIMKKLAQDFLEETRASGAKACKYLAQALCEDPYYKTHVRGIRGAPFKVLMNRFMPAILLEVGFIDHPQEGANLASPAFQKKVARLLAAGIRKYLSQEEAELGKLAGH